MKTIFNTLFITAAAVFAFSCEKPANDYITPSEENLVELTLTVGADTKTQLGGENNTSIIWQENDKLIVFAQEMGKDNLPALIREAEHNRRMKEMRAQYERMMSMNNMSAEELADMFPETEELVVNTDSPLITKLEALESMGTKKEEADRLAQHIYDQAKLAHGSLDSEGLERFLKYNTELLSKSADNL